MSAQSRGLLGQPGGRALVRWCRLPGARRRSTASTAAGGAAAPAPGLAAVAATSKRLSRHGCHCCIFLAAVLGNGVDGGGGVMGPPGAVRPQLIRPQLKLAKTPTQSESLETICDNDGVPFDSNGERSSHIHRYYKSLYKRPLQLNNGPDLSIEDFLGECSNEPDVINSKTVMKKKTVLIDLLALSNSIMQSKMQKKTRHREPTVLVTVSF
jgi:hypothetical protein